MSKIPGFTALNVSVGFMSTVYKLAIHTHQKMSTFCAQIAMQLDNIKFSVEQTYIHLVLYSNEDCHCNLFW